MKKLVDVAGVNAASYSQDGRHAAGDCLSAYNRRRRLGGQA